MLEFRSAFFKDLTDIEREMDRFLGHLSTCQRYPAIVSSSWQPPIDVYETPDEVVVLVDIAGVDQNAVQVVTDRDALSIRGERADRRRRRDLAFHRMEITFGSFERTIALPALVDPEMTRASYVDGFLEVTMSKVKDIVPTRITIKITKT